MPHAWNWLRAEAIDCYDEVQNKKFFFLPGGRVNSGHTKAFFFFFSYLIPLIIIQEANRR